MFNMYNVSEDPVAKLRERKERLDKELSDKVSKDYNELMRKTNENLDALRQGNKSFYAQKAQEELDRWEQAMKSGNTIAAVSHKMMSETYLALARALWSSLFSYSLFPIFDGWSNENVVSLPLKLGTVISSGKTIHIFGGKHLVIHIIFCNDAQHFSPMDNQYRRKVSTSSIKGKCPLGPLTKLGQDYPVSAILTKRTSHLE